MWSWNLGSTKTSLATDGFVSCSWKGEREKVVSITLIQSCNYLVVVIGHYYCYCSYMHLPVYPHDCLLPVYLS